MKLKWQTPPIKFISHTCHGRRHFSNFGDNSSIAHTFSIEKLYCKCKHCIMYINYY